MNARASVNKICGIKEHRGDYIS